MKNLKTTPAVIFIRRIVLLNIMIFLLIVLLVSCKNNNNEKSEAELMEMAMKICQNNIILDSHIDWPEWNLSNPGDISEETTKGDFDLIRANKGGLNAALSVVWIYSSYSVGEGRIMVDSMLKMITGYTAKYPDKFAIARNPGDIRKNFSNKLFSFPLCLENGTPIGNNPGYLKYLKERGIISITLNHDKTNQISDSNYDTNRVWNGLSPLGLEVIKEMNHLGIMIDISHSTDSTVFQSLRYSKAPIIASHSSCRYFTPGFERNLSDTLIKLIADKKGVIMINFGSRFLDSICGKNRDSVYNWFQANGTDLYSKKGWDFRQKFAETHKLNSNSGELVNHIDHIVKIAGVDYVGIGSDYDGIGPSQPTDLPDVSSYPTIVFELLKRGYTEKDIKKILSGNFLRVWNDVIRISDSLNKSIINQKKIRPA